MAICIQKYYYNKLDQKSYVIYHKEGSLFITDGSSIKKDSRDRQFYSTMAEGLSSCDVLQIIDSLREMAKHPEIGNDYSELADEIVSNLAERKKPIREFTLMDEDSFQIMRPWLDDNYEFYQLQYLSEGDGIFVCHGMINLDSINLKSIMDCYGYSNINEIKNDYGKEYKRFLAQCAFELLCADGKCILTPTRPVGWVEGINIIQSLSGYSK